MKKSWHEVAKTAQDYRAASIARVKPQIPELPASLPLDVTKLPKQLLFEQEIFITQLETQDLLLELSTGKLSCIVVTNAFLRRAGLAQQLVNCVTELLPERALARAKFLDDYLTEYKKPIGPLHGLPISVKEHIGMKDLGLNAGFISWWDEKAEDDAHILRILWNAGAVFHARTTQPQTLMHLETSSNFYGETVNPFNRNLTSGGSSGGEGALVGLRGSCLGIGTDIGGSIRSPAGNCGVYGLRPTSFRLPMNGLSATMMGSDHIIPVIGPLSTSLQGISLFMKTILAAKPWLEEPSLVPIPWKGLSTGKSEKQTRKLKIGVLWSDGVVKPHPPVVRALGEVVEKLKGVPGVEIVKWKPYKHDEAWNIVASLYFVDGAKDASTAIDASGEPWRPLSNFIIKENPFVKYHSIEDMWQWQYKRELYKKEYARLWNDTATGEDANGELQGTVDVILCPVGPSAAPLLDTAKYWGYTSQWNLLDYPAIVFPVSKVDAKLDVKERDYKPMNDKDEFNYNLYDAQKFHGAPISLQLVARRYEDEKLIDTLSYIKDAIGLPFSEYF